MIDLIERLKHGAIVAGQAAVDEGTSTLAADLMIEAASALAATQAERDAAIAEVSALTRERDAAREANMTTTLVLAVARQDALDAQAERDSANTNWEAEHAECDRQFIARRKAEATIATLRAALVAQQEREGLVAWQPISTAPTDGTTVLLTDGHYVRTGYYARRINVWSVDTTVALPIPTRWCTIPPPTETQEPQS